MKKSVKEARAGLIPASDFPEKRRDMRRYAVSPKGKEITGVFETCPCRAHISEIFRNEKGEVEFQYAGESEMFWDEQKPVLRENKMVFLDEDGNEWTEDQLTFKKVAE